MVEVIITALVGIAYAIMILALAIVPISLLIGLGLGLHWAIQQRMRFSIHDLLIVATTTALILKLVTAMKFIRMFTPLP